jgi:hypothetical protein
MSQFHVVILATLLNLAVGPWCGAQPLFTTVHDWTVDTPAGEFGYQQIRQDPGGWQTHYLVLGKSGRFQFDIAILFVFGLIVLILAGIFSVRRFVRKRGA